MTIRLVVMSISASSHSTHSCKRKQWFGGGEFGFLPGFASCHRTTLASYHVIAEVQGKHSMISTKDKDL